MALEAALMVILIGIGKGQALSVTRMDSMKECSDAKAAITSHFDSTWDPGYIDPKNVTCLPIVPGREVPAAAVPRSGRSAFPSVPNGE